MPLAFLPPRPFHPTVSVTEGLEITAVVFVIAAGVIWWFFFKPESASSGIKDRTDA